MKYKDLEKEGWIKFEDKTILEKNITNNKLCKLVYGVYKNNVKYNKDNVNEKLRERFNNIKYINKKLDKVTKLSFIKNVICYGNTIDLLVLDVNQESFIILDTSSGIDMSNYDNLHLIENNKTKEKVLYTNNNKIEEDVINICNIESVILYRNANIYNKLTNEEIDTSDYIEFKDLNNNIFYIDILFNKIYKRNNIYIKNNKDSKEILLFKENIKLNYEEKIFNNKKFNIMKLFFNFEE